MARTGSPQRLVECSDRVPSIEKPLDQKFEESPRRNNKRTVLRESQTRPVNALGRPVGTAICPEYRSELTSGRENAKCREPHSQNLAKGGLEESRLCPTKAPELPAEAQIGPEYRSKPISGHGNAECQEPYPENDATKNPQASQPCPANDPQLPVETGICAEDRSKPTSSDGNAELARAFREFRDIRPAPLGPLPRSGDPSVSQKYWAPLADLTGSRPAVENFSTTRYSPAEWQLRSDRAFNDSRNSIRNERYVN